MEASKANLINSITLITIGGWGYFSGSSMTALIPVMFGVVLLLCNNGIKKENKLMFKKSFFLLYIILFISCDSKSIFSEYKSVSNDWKKNEKVDFSFSAPDTTNTYNMFINLRNDKTYEFSNLFLIVRMSFPDGKIISDTIEYEMAKPNGEWLGKGFTSLKESKLWYKENITFPNSGIYNIQIEHAMRINGKVDGIESLRGIKDVGVKIENTSIQ